MQLIHTHVPKTAGTAFHTHLKRWFPRCGGVHIAGFDTAYLGVFIGDRRSKWWSDREQFKSEWRREIQAPHYGAADVLIGHYPLELFDGLWPEAKRVCWLRHPVSLVISWYRFDRDIAGRLAPGTSIYDYLEEYDFRNNIMTTMTGGRLGDYWFIGLREMFDEHLAVFAHMLGLPLPERIPPKATNSQSRKEEFMRLVGDPKIRKEVYRRNRADVSLYLEAVNRTLKTLH